MWGGLLATSGFGVPVPERDQSLVPSALFARTCTAYRVPATSPVMIWLVSAPVRSTSVFQPPLPAIPQRTS